MHKPRMISMWTLALIIAVATVTLSWPDTVRAIQVTLPPPPNTPTNTPIPTDTPEEPTDTPTPQPKPTNTYTPVPPPTDTNTPVPPPTDTNTPVPPPSNTPKPTASHTAVPPTPSPTRGPGEPSPQPNPECQSAVSGSVLNRAGERVAGVTVIIEGDGWSSGILSDADGRYGFSGLCAGTVTLQAYWPGGEQSPAISVDLTGRNQVSLDISSAQTGVSTATLSPTERASGQTATVAPEMPETGSTRVISVWGVAAAVLLVLVAGLRRALLIPRSARNED